MSTQLLEIEFTVVDEIRVNRKWATEYPEWKGFCDGKLLVLTPSCAGEPEIANLNALATTPSGKEVSLAFDKVIVNKAGRVSLFFEGIFTKTVPNGSKVRFGKNSEDVRDDDAKYITQGKLNVPEADRILPRLEKEGVRFQIDTDLSTHPVGRDGSFRDSRIELFIHVDDVQAWEKIGSDYFPE